MIQVDQGFLYEMRRQLRLIKKSQLASKEWVGLVEGYDLILNKIIKSYGGADKTPALYDVKLWEDFVDMTIKNGIDNIVARFKEILTIEYVMGLVEGQTFEN